MEDNESAIQNQIDEIIARASNTSAAMVDPEHLTGGHRRQIRSPRVQIRLESAQYGASARTNDQAMFVRSVTEMRPQPHSIRHDAQTARSPVFPLLATPIQQTAPVQAGGSLPLSEHVPPIVVTCPEPGFSLPVLDDGHHAAAHQPKSLQGEGRLPGVPNNSDPTSIASPDRANLRPEAERFICAKDFKRQMGAARFTFWVVGRVFEAPWAQPLGGDDSDNDRTVSSASVSIQGYRYHVKRRIFVIIKLYHDHCQALPIYTYDGRGVASSHLRKAEHCIVYTSDEAPNQLHGEAPERGQLPMSMSPLKVLMSDRKGIGLHPASRLNFGKLTSPVEYNIRVKDFGMVHPKDIEALLSHHAKVEKDRKESIRKRAQRERKAKESHSITGSASDYTPALQRPAQAAISGSEEKHPPSLVQRVAAT